MFENRAHGIRGGFFVKCPLTRKHFIQNAAQTEYIGAMVDGLGAHLLGRHVGDRADHGAGVGWTDNTADTGLVVNGDNVTAYGLFVEHYQKYEVIWNGNGGTDIFLQNEMPYDPPGQAAWMEAPGVDGWAAFKLANAVTSFSGYGMGSYSFFNQGINIYAANAFEVPGTLPAESLHDLLTIFLSTAGSGGILNVINNTGGSSTIANPDTPVTVVSFP